MIITDLTCNFQLTHNPKIQYKAKYDQTLITIRRSTSFIYIFSSPALLSVDIESILCSEIIYRSAKCLISTPIIPENSFQTCHLLRLMKMHALLKSKKLPSCLQWCRWAHANLVADRKKSHGRTWKLERCLERWNCLDWSDKPVLCCFGENFSHTNDSLIRDKSLLWV